MSSIISAVTLGRVLREVKARFVLGLTATPTRKNGRQPIAYAQGGSIQFHLGAKEAVEASPHEHEVILRFTDSVWPAWPGFRPDDFLSRLTR
jgi:superfamily II DNA or RNA helicase